MIGLNYKLEQLEAQGKPIYAGIVGAGQMGRGLVGQIASMRGMRPAIVSDTTIEKARIAFQNAGYLEGRDFCAAHTVEEADKLLQDGIFVITSNNALVTGCAKIDCVVDATGVPESGAKIALDAIHGRKHIVMLNVETDVCVGNILYQMAQDAGVVYTGSAGDEPGAIIELYDFAKALGFEVRAAGKGKNNKIDCDATPDSVAADAARKGTSARMMCAFKDGTNTMVEMTAVANATGLVPDIAGMHGAKGSVKELPDILSLKSEGRGGILERYGVVEYIDGVAPGVFLIAACDQPEPRKELAYLEMGDGPNYCLYRPYHLCSLETPLSVARACIDREPTLVPRAGFVAETCTVAKKDLKAGEPLGGIGGYAIRGILTTAGEAQEKNALPIGLVTPKTVLLRDLKKGEFITYSDVCLDSESPIVKLRKLQDERF